MGFTGPWFGTVPPKSYCAICGATEARNKAVIPMEHPGKAFEKGIGIDIYESIDKSYYKFDSMFDSVMSPVDRAFENIEKFFGKVKGKKKEE